MNATAELSDGVRQWVLTLPYRLRYALAWDHRLCRSVLAVFARAVLGFERRRARRRGVRDGAGGAVTAIQRFGSALNYHGVFAPNARCRRNAVCPGRLRAQQDAVSHTANAEAGAVTAPEVPGGPPRTVAAPGSPDSSATVLDSRASPEAQPPKTGYTRTKHHSWAELLSRTFQIDVLACPGCGGRLRLIATIEHRAVIEKILRYLGLSGELPDPAPPRQPPWLPGFEAPTDAATEWRD